MKHQFLLSVSSRRKSKVLRTEAELLSCRGCWGSLRNSVYVEIVGNFYPTVRASAWSSPRSYEGPVGGGTVDEPSCVYIPFHQWSSYPVRKVLSQ